METPGDRPSKGETLPAEGPPASRDVRTCPSASSPSVAAAPPGPGHLLPLTWQHGGALSGPRPSQWCVPLTAVPTQGDGEGVPALTTRQEEVTGCCRVVGLRPCPALSPGQGHSPGRVPPPGAADGVALVCTRTSLGLGQFLAVGRPHTGWWSAASWPLPTRCQRYHPHHCGDQECPQVLPSIPGETAMGHQAERRWPGHHWDPQGGTPHPPCATSVQSAAGSWTLQAGPWPPARCH